MVYVPGVDHPFHAMVGPIDGSATVLPAAGPLLSKGDEQKSIAFLIIFLTETKLGPLLTHARTMYLHFESPTQTDTRHPLLTYVFFFKYVSLLFFFHRLLRRTEPSRRRTLNMARIIICFLQIALSLARSLAQTGRLC